MNYAFLETDWFWTACQFGLALITTGVAFRQWRIDSEQKLKEEKKQTLSKVVENDLRMKEAYRSTWFMISTFKGEAQQQFAFKDVKDIKDPVLRASLFQVVDILSDVFYYYKRFEVPIETTQWIKNFHHTFHPVEKKAFVTAFEKYVDEKQFSEDFVKFVREIIKQNQEPKA